MNNSVLYIFQVLLHSHQWNIHEVTKKCKENSTHVSLKIEPNNSSNNFFTRYMNCPVCVTIQPIEKFYRLSCAHMFCKECWTSHFEVQINQVCLMVW